MSRVGISRGRDTSRHIVTLRRPGSMCRDVSTVSGRSGHKHEGLYSRVGDSSRRLRWSLYRQVLLWRRRSDRCECDSVRGILSAEGVDHDRSRAAGDLGAPLGAAAAVGGTSASFNAEASNIQPAPARCRLRGVALTRHSAKNSKSLGLSWIETFQ